jgi:U3 small nucleolar RNA-associated protein 10
MLKNDDVSRFVTSLLPNTTKKGLNHRVLVAFNAATLHDFIKRSKSINEGTISYLLPALLEPLKPKSKNLSQDPVLGSFILLATLSQKCQLSSDALKLIVGSMASCAHVVRGDQFISSLVAVCQPQLEIEDFTLATFKYIVALSDIQTSLASGSGYNGSEKVLTPLVKGLTKRYAEPFSSWKHVLIKYRLDDASLLESIIATPSTPIDTVATLTVHLMTVSVNAEIDSQNQLTSRRLLALVQQRHPAILASCADATMESDESLKEAVEQLVISLSVVSDLLQFSRYIA